MSLIQEAIARVVTGACLREEAMYALMNSLLDGAATPAQIASLLTALRMRGETVDELVGATRAMRDRMTRVVAPPGAVDTCGTGGDGAETFNVSTAAALVAAGAGAVVAKHGNRKVSSRVGSADVLEALGVYVDLPAAGVERCLARAGMGFCFAPRFHAAMGFAAAPRREIGIRTMLNLLGPLANPAGASAQLIGVFAPQWTEPLAQVLARLGTTRALVVHGLEGIDEISARGATRVSEVAAGAVRTYDLTPESFGLRRSAGKPASIADPEEGAAVIREVLAGQAGPDRDVVLVNAAAVLVVAGAAADWRAGVAQAAAAIDSGAASAVLARLVETSNEAARDMRAEIESR